MTYTTQRLWEEVVYVSYHLHWSLASVLDLEHPVRRRVIAEVSEINERLSAAE
nr:asparaginase [Streptacidiphilus anmyonensis]